LLGHGQFFFYRDAAMLARSWEVGSRNSVRPFVRLSVCPPVCVSHAYFVTR